MEAKATRRIMTEMRRAEADKEVLAARGIYVKVNPQNVFQWYVLIIPQHKQHIDDAEWISPYTHGFFVFELTIPHNYPFEQPKAIFFPQNNYRYHPNYYSMGKVCLSILGTWGKNDWCASMNMMTVVNILEERFNEMSLCFEPSFENADASTVKTYNHVVEYGKWDGCMCWVFESHFPGVYSLFKEEILNYVREKKDGLLENLARLKVQWARNTRTVAPRIHNHGRIIRYEEMVFRWADIMNKLEAGHYNP